MREGVRRQLRWGVSAVAPQPTEGGGLQGPERMTGITSGEKTLVGCGGTSGWLCYRQRTHLYEKECEPARAMKAREQESHLLAHSCSSFVVSPVWTGRVAHINERKEPFGRDRERNQDGGW